MKPIAVLFTAVLVFAGCGASDVTADPSASAPVAEDAGPVVDIVIKDGKAVPHGERVEAKIGAKITLRIAADADEEIHVHSDPEHTYRVKAGDTITETLTIGTPGQVAVEAHELGVTIVQLVVRP